MTQKTQTKSVDAPTGLVGTFGHTLKPDGYLQWQFIVLRPIGPDHHAVELYDWLAGSPTGEIAVLGNEALFDRDRARLYSCPSAWIEGAKALSNKHKWADEDDFELV